MDYLLRCARWRSAVACSKAATPSFHPTQLGPEHHPHSNRPMRNTSRSLHPCSWKPLKALLSAKLSCRKGCRELHQNSHLLSSHSTSNLQDFEEQLPSQRPRLHQSQLPHSQGFQAQEDAEGRSGCHLGVVQPTVAFALRLGKSSPHHHLHPNPRKWAGPKKCWTCGQKGSFPANVWSTFFNACLKPNVPLPAKHACVTVHVNLPMALYTGVKTNFCKWVNKHKYIYIYLGKL